MKPAPLDAYLAHPLPHEDVLRRIFRNRPGLRILDIGACEGEDSIRYARLFPGAEIFAFEPLPANQDLIRANLERYSADGIELVPAALSDHEGEARFHVSSGKPPEEFAGKEWNYGNKSNSLLPPSEEQPMFGWIKFDETTAVRTLTLDGFCRERGIRRIDFIHMDVQGAEHLVLAGAGHMLTRTTALWMEVSDRALYQGQRLRRETEAFMRCRGFVIAHEERRDIEGDQLYLNLRHPRCWPVVAERAARTTARKIKRALLSP